jgi:hypothetical protein
VVPVHGSFLPALEAGVSEGSNDESEDDELRAAEGCNRCSQSDDCDLELDEISDDEIGYEMESVIGSSALAPGRGPRQVSHLGALCLSTVRFLLGLDLVKLKKKMMKLPD